MPRLPAGAKKKSQADASADYLINLQANDPEKFKARAAKRAERERLRRQKAKEEREQSQKAQAKSKAYERERKKSYRDRVTRGEKWNGREWVVPQPEDCVDLTTVHDDQPTAAPDWPEPGPSVPFATLHTSPDQHQKSSCAPKTRSKTPVVLGQLIHQTRKKGPGGKRSKPVNPPSIAVTQEEDQPLVTEEVATPLVPQEVDPPSPRQEVDNEPGKDGKHHPPASQEGDGPRVPKAVRRLFETSTGTPPMVTAKKRSVRKPKGWMAKRGVNRVSARNLLKEKPDVYITAVDGPAHGSGFVSETVMPISDQITQDLRGYTPRKYYKRAERIRNKKRKLEGELRHHKHKTAIETTRLKRQVAGLLRQLRESAKVTGQVKDMFGRMASAKQKAKTFRLIASPSKVKKARATKAFQKVTGLSRKAIQNKPKGRREAKARVAKKTLRVTQFLCDPQWSITLPGKKDVVSCRYEMYDGNNRKRVIRKLLPKVQLTEHIGKLHEIYLEQNPDLPVCLTFFKNVRARAQYIRLLDQAKPDVCLCQKDQNFALKMRVFKKYNHSKDNTVETVPETIVRKMDVSTFNRKVDEWSANLPPTVYFQEWKHVFVPLDDPKINKVVKKLRAVLMDISKDKFVKAVKAAYPTIKVHIELAAHQHKTVRNQRANLKKGFRSCTVQMDFAQNWLVGFGQEVQSAFYAKDPVTVHPVVVHMRNHNGELVTVSLCIVSDDRKHDAGAVVAIVDAIIAWLKERYPDLEMVHFWSDSPTSQYRNISVFSLICRHLDRYGMQCTWSYFEAGHGKGPCDGVGAAAKRKADRCVKAGGNITNAAEFAANNAKGDGAVSYIVVPVADMYASRDMLNWFVSPKKVPGTMKVHDVMVDEPGVSILVRRMSCYDACCWDQQSMRPVLPQRECSHGQLGNWARNVLFTPAVYDLLKKKEKQFVQKQRELALKAGEEAKKEAARLNARGEKYEKGDWVAAIWCETWWIGIVESEAVHHKYVIKFMHPLDSTPTEECKIDWPKQDDIEAIPREDILCVVSKPVPAMHKHRWCFTLPSNEVKNVIDRFDNWC